MISLRFLVSFANRVFHEQVLMLLGPPYLKFYKFAPLTAECGFCTNFFLLRGKWGEKRCDLNSTI